MIYSLYIISEGGIAVYSKNFVRASLDEQLISGFLLAVGNFAKEAVGSGLKKIEMQTGEQLLIYYDETLKLSIAALTGAQDHPKLILNILQDILDKFNTAFNKKSIQIGNLGDTSKFDSEITTLLKDKTAKRDKKRFILALILGSVILAFLYLLFWENLINLLTLFIPQIGTLFNEGKHIEMLFVFGEFSFNLEFILIICFIPSTLLAGYLAGSRKKGKLLGLIFFFFAVGSSISLIIIFNDNQPILLFAFLFFLILLIYVPLVLITSITFSYLGGLIRDRRKLYPIPPEKAID
ncbi:MAG: hypothetical protein ACTSYB_11415 [Candidatus Helarchaeota archaeon]